MTEAPPAMSAPRPAALSSMTGFARAAGRFGAWDWCWEARSVNGKALDLRLRLPTGAEALDAPARALVARTLKRGSVTLSLSLSIADREPEVRVNRPLLDRLVALAAEIDSPAVERPRLDGLLALRGVLEVAAETPESPEDRTAREAALVAGLEGCLADLVTARQDEGARLGALVADHLGRLEDLIAQASATEALRPEALRARLTRQMSEILEALPSPQTLDAGGRDRLAQELALLAVKGDVREELDRLSAHVAGARDILADPQAETKGRRLEFLAQELNREANTLCSKAQDVTLTRIGLDMKAVIDQFREQILNIA